MDKDSSAISSTQPWGFWKWVKVISPILLLVVVIAIASFYFQGKFFTFVGARFPELKVVSAALQENYPNQDNINVNVWAVKNGNGTQRNVVISLVNSAAISKSGMVEMARVACSALKSANLRIDTLTIQPVGQVSVPFFDASYAPDGMGGSCDWWMTTSTPGKGR